ncbi:class II glutamine amidotransferase [Aliidongia dinghuensis]|uniref:Class II glutamine amidotransferase n=1 Tax=Aliidongia dinghuensis TaxID=1867774 RepID=A0A8J2YRX1_9PROT|nr:class II glutamine amidotransferase [Aliidongia dinghuensis]GGF07820.1 class II glutamine amidotransferase [Aliidongia dinghuensis]
MCRWLSYLGPETYFDRLLYEPQYSLVQQALAARKSISTTQGDGFGLGWYGDHPDPGLYREALPAWNDRNLRSLARQLRARLFFAHVRASTGTDTARSNCHPFAHDKWLFMHNGQIGGYARLRRRLEAKIPDALYPLRAGTTDSETAFYLLFRHDPDADPAAAIRAMLADIEAERLGASIDEPLRFTAALSDGRRIVAVRYASDDRPPSLYWREDDGAVIIVSEPLDGDGQRWNRVPRNHFLVTAPDQGVTLRPIAM